MGILIKKYLWVANLLAVAICSYFLAKIVSVFIADKLIVERNFTLPPASPDSILAKAIPSFEQYRIILDRNMFDSRELATTTTPEEMPTEAPNLEGPATKTALAIKLLSTFSVGSGLDQRSTATIQASGGPEVYTVADEKQFAPGVKITKILPTRIEFINGPRLEYAEIENFSATGVSTNAPLSKIDPGMGGKTGGTGVAKQGDNKFVVDKTEIDNALSNIDKLFTQVQAVPNFVAGKPAGIKLLAMTPTSIFAKLGLQRGDVLERINGSELDIASGMNLFNQLKNQNHITIDLTRNGKKQTLDYEIR